MADGTPSRFGQVQGAGATDALWLEIFGGEVLTAYDSAKKLKPTVRVRTISGAKSADFPAVWDAQAAYHTPGTEIVGQQIQSNKVVVTLDDMLIAPVEVAQIDELKSYFDVRAPYAEALGRALALFEDRTIGQNIVAAARGAALFTGDAAGGNVTQANVGGTADFSASGSDLIAAINLALQKLDTNEVPVDTMPTYAAFKPAQFYLIANSDKNQNSLFGGQGGTAKAVTSLTTISGVQVFKSNALLYGFNVTTWVTATNATGIVKGAGGVAAATLPMHGALPANYPAKYQSDLTNTRGVVYCEPAVAYLQLLGVTMESTWLTVRQTNLILAKMAIGMGALRSKAAIEIKTS
jgi:hypothetical protein